MLRVSDAIPPIKEMLLISIAISFGGFFPSTLVNISIFLYFSSCTNLNVCKEGVADPSTIGIFSS